MRTKWGCPPYGIDSSPSHRYEVAMDPIPRPCPEDHENRLDYLPLAARLAACQLELELTFHSLSSLVVHRFHME